MSNQVNTLDLKSFHYLENGEIGFSALDTIKTTNILDSGFYSLFYEGHPTYNVRVSLLVNKESVKLHSFPDKEKLDNIFKMFFDNSIYQKITNLGFYHKLGILMYGKEGCGKSTILKYYCNQAIIKNGALVFYITQQDHDLTHCWNFITNIRKIQNNPVIVVFEEMDVLVNRNLESLLKTILDGNLSIDNCIFFATTNYINQIPEALKNRPSRFKYSINIEGIHSEVDIYPIIEKMLKDKFSEEEFKEWSIELKGSSLDEIKQFCIDKIMDIESYSRDRKRLGFSVVSN